MTNVAAARQVDALTREWLRGLDSARTRDGYGRDLAAFVAWCAEQGCSPLHARPADVDRYRDACGAAGARPSTIARRLSALSSFYDHAAASRAVAANPAASVRRPAPSTAATRSRFGEPEAIAMFEAAVSLGPKVTVLVALLLLEGLKLGEALALDVDELGRSDRTMRVSVARRGAAATVQLDGRTARAITRYLGGRVAGPLLIGDSPTWHGTTRLTRFGADFLVKRAAQRAGLGPHVSANTLRRSYIELSHRDGTKVQDIQRRVGHANVRDTRRYLRG